MISFTAQGHPSITATHETTIEITRDTHLTERGTCILGVKAEKGLRDLKHFLDLHKSRKIRVDLLVGEKTDTVTGYLDPCLSFLDVNDIVIRKSAYLCDRTLMVHADKAAAEIDRELIERLREGDGLTVEISVI